MSRYVLVGDRWIYLVSYFHGKASIIYEGKFTYAQKQAVPE